MNDSISGSFARQEAKFANWVGNEASGKIIDWIEWNDYYKNPLPYVFLWRWNGYGGVF